MKKNFLLFTMLFVVFIGRSQIIDKQSAIQHVMQRNPDVVIGELIKVIPSLKDLKADTSLNRSKIKDMVAADDVLEEAEEKRRTQDYSVTPVPDPVVQRSIIPSVPGNPNSPNYPDPPLGGSAMLNFDGMGYTNVAPADPSLCAGPNHVIQMINGSSGGYIKIWNRNGVLVV